MCNAVAVMALSAISIGCTNSGKPALNTQAASLSASQTVNNGASSFNEEYERFTLENELTV